MAYLDSNIAAARPASLQELPEIQNVQLSPLEWMIVAMARRDGLGSLSEPGPIARAFGGLFGLGRHSRLADPRLEQLRRLAVQAWHYGYAVPVSEMKAFKAAGFSLDQLEALLASVSGARMQQRRTRSA